jgi:hypothetical protein
LVKGAIIILYKHMQKTLINKTAKLFSIASLFLFSGIVVFALQTASGWTNPSSNPPGAPGALYYSNGNVGVSTNNPTSTLSVNGVISAMGNKVVDVADPTADKDAVNLGYLQTQISAAGAGSGGTITIFGLSNTYAPFATFSKDPGSTTNIYNCLFGDFENCGPFPFSYGITSLPAGGTGIACPAGYTSIFNGYGPYSYVERNYYFDTPTGGDDDSVNVEILSNTLTDKRVAQSYSICGASTSLVVKSDYSLKNGVVGSGQAGTGAVAGIASACVPQKLSTPPYTKYYVCNTCRICEKN